MEKSTGDQKDVLVDIIEGQVKRTSGPGSKYVDPLMMTQVSLVAKTIGFEWRLYPKLAVFEDTEANRQKALQRIAHDTAIKKTQSSDAKRRNLLATPAGMKAIQELADKQAKKKKTADEKKQPKVTATATKKAEKERLQAEKNQLYYDKYVACLAPVAAAPVQTPASSSKGDGKKGKLTPEEWLAGDY